MAGTMPHAVFVETDLDGGVAAYAAELPGCATFAGTDDEAVAEMPRRASRFPAWLRDHGEPAPSFVGDNWYEVERAAATAERRAAFSLDELPPTEAEHAGWLRWLELAREDLAEALDEHGYDAATDALTGIERQDLGFVRELGATEPQLPTDPVDRLYAARDALTDALEATGPMHEAVRRIFRLAIADDLRAVEHLRAGGER
jgi:predicted RNase H-like HicB family nuclease